MTAPDTEQLTQAMRQLWKARSSLQRSLQPLHWLGYAILALGFIDLIDVVTPPMLMNPRWEFQTIGQIIEQVPVLLVGFGFIFLGGTEDRNQWELFLVRILSWLTLVVGVVYLLLIPLNLASGIRVDRLNQRQISTQTEELQAQIDDAKAEVATIQDADELRGFIQAVQGQTAPELDSINDVSALRSELTAAIEAQETSIASEVESVQRVRRLDLISRLIKWNIGALIAGAIYLLMWRSTSWARHRSS